MYKNTTQILKHIPLLVLLFFLLNIAGPTLVLLNSNTELSAVVISLENETETNEIEDLNEFVFSKTQPHHTTPCKSNQSLLFDVYTNSFSEIHIEHISPPPEYI